MNKISQYLNEHILGEVSSADYVIRQFSRDASVLTIKPELVIHPRQTNDIRKIARFTWQLAEKGHIMPITVRGGGTDRTGAAIGKGIIINTLSHLNKIIFINLRDKDQFVHVQPGVVMSTLNEAIKSHGLCIPATPMSDQYSTIGGAIANNAAGPLSGICGNIGSYVTRLEVILANGDVIETGRISKHELIKKKGLQTLEGEIYRKIDGLIDDNQQLINDKISKKLCDNCGYSGISAVKQGNGSFDLTPLFIGSQGTLGIISEMVVKTQFCSNENTLAVLSFSDASAARDAADAIVPVKPAILEYIEGTLFANAKSLGKKYLINKNDQPDPAAVLFVSLNDFGAKARQHKLKQIQKILSKYECSIITNNDYADEELTAIRDVSSTLYQSDKNNASYPSLIDGAAIPGQYMGGFIEAIRDLEKRDHIELPLQIQWLNGIVHTRPALQLHLISDKQKLFKLISDYFEIVNKFGGAISTESSEGRLKSFAAYNQLDKDLTNLYSEIKTAFDPFGTLNPGVKQPIDIKTIISQLNPSYNLADIAKYSPKS